MPFYGSIVVIKSSGEDGSSFSLIDEECFLGRAEGCDIRIELPTVSKKHAKIKVQVTDGAVNWVNIIALSKTNNTNVNGVSIPSGIPLLLSHNDQFTIGNRHFRWEYPIGSPLLSKRERTPEAERSNKMNQDTDKAKKRHLDEAMMKLDEALVEMDEALVEMDMERRKEEQEMVSLKKEVESIEDMQKETLQILIKEKKESIKEMESSLECPVCLETANIPIFRCSKEHLICSKCRHRISNCPVCRETYQGNPERYRLAEKIVQEVGKMKEQLVAMKMAG